MGGRLELDVHQLGGQRAKRPYHRRGLRGAVIKWPMERSPLRLRSRLSVPPPVRTSVATTVASSAVAATVATAAISASITTAIALTATPRDATATFTRAFTATPSGSAGPTAAFPFAVTAASFRASFTPSTLAVDPPAAALTAAAAEPTAS